MQLFLLLSLALFRISYMLVEEEGPYQVFQKLRNSAEDKPWNPLWCFNCTSVSVALLFFLIFGLTWWYALGLSAMAMFIYSIHEKLS